MNLSRRSGSYLERVHAHRPGIDAVLAAALVAYGALYLGWQSFRWGSPDIQLFIADASFIPFGVVGTAFALLAARRAQTRPMRRAWIAISLALAAFCAGDVAWFFLEAVLGVSPYPSVADVGYLAFYPFLLIGLLALPRRRPQNPGRTLLDMAIVAVGSGVVVWRLVLQPVAGAGSGFGVETFVALAYPVGDLLLIFGLAVTFVSRVVGTSRVVLGLLAVGLVLNVVADLSYARLSLDQTYESGTWMDACWALGWVFMGLAGFVQARARADARQLATVVEPTRLVSLLPYLAVAAVWGLLLGATDDPGSSLAVFVAGAIGIVSLVIRQVLIGRENARLLADKVASRSAARFQSIIQNANDVIAVVDRDAIISYLTPSAARLVDRSVDSLIGQGLDTLLEPEDVPLALELLRAAATRPGPGDTVQCRARTAANGQLHVELNVANLLDDPFVHGLVVTMRDVTERRQFEEQLRDQAFHDPLTGLANRALLADRIEQALRRGRRHRATPALLYLDLDNFKAVNDSLGHRAGDRVLVEVARRLSGAIRAEDTAARLGGDEFAVLIDETRSVEEVIAVADRILADLRPPIEGDGTAVAIGASIGIVRPEARGSEPVDLLRDGDIAMYEAKRQARGSYRLFEQAMFDATVERVNLEADLRAALDGDQLEVVYQPLFNMSDGHLASVEALLRWNHPVRGLVMPTQFIPLAEQTGEIVRIGRWVLGQACRTVGGLNAIAGARQIRANVNVSARQLEPRFVEDVAEVVRQTGFPAQLLVLEITESVFAAERPGVLQVLAALRSLGVRISIDDFGTGYSSLSMLRDLPVDELKIDRSFINALTNHGDAGLIEAIIKISHDFDLTTVAEGIELEEQASRLRGLGCDTGQGFLLGRPGPPAAIETLIQERLNPSRVIGSLSA
jgi:diguanylate cyclase (GGDEF)-like protein/PAS domain S-box-containing protein